MLNDMWQDVPDSEGIWWGANPSFPKHWVVALVSQEGGRMATELRVHLAGEACDHPVDHFKGTLVWQKAGMPIYYWPTPDYSH